MIKRYIIIMFNKKTFLLLFLLIIVIGAVSTVSAADLSDDSAADSTNKMEVEDIVIDEGNDDTLSQADIESDEDAILANDESSDAVGVETKSFNNLQYLIDNTFSGGTVSLSYDYSWTTEFGQASGVMIKKPITINGNGHTLDALEQSRIFIIYCDGVVLNDIKFVNAYGDSASNGFAGALSLLNNQTTINRCDFINNTAEGGGGAIASAGSITINKCNFINNHAKEDGGAIYSFYPKKGDVALNIADSTFSGNWADSYGGAMYLSAYTSNGLAALTPIKTYLKNSVFEYNEAVYGGVIFNSHDTDILNCRFSNNEVSGGGGAIYMPAGLLLTGEHNRVYAYPFTLTIHGTSSFIDNYAGYYGAAIRVGSGSNYEEYGIKGKLRVYDNVLFQANYADKGPGGALSLDRSDSIVENARFVDNEVYYDEDGGAMYGGMAIDCTFEKSTDTTNDVQVIKRAATLKQSGSGYNDKVITVTLTDANSKTLLANADIAIKFSNGKTVSLRTNSKGVATYKVPFNPGTYTASVIYPKSNNKVATTAKVVISKATPKISAKKISLKAKKAKKYSIVLKDNKGKAIKKAKVTLKLKGKTFKAKTNAKGKAVFKLKLNKKLTAKATIKYGGNSLYKAVSKKVKVVVKK